ncbi:MAG: GNAT family N-acetyltransferase [Dehalococcoidia bacterium]
MKQATEVILASGEHTERMGRAMGKAFQNEPNFTYIIPDEAKRERALQWFFGTFTARLGFWYGKIYTTPDALGGAVWMAPGNKVTFGGALRAGLLSMPWRFGWGGLRRSMEISSHIDRMRKDVAPERHWYLMALGIDPAAQGKGIGSALVGPTLAQTDAEAVDCYLETFSERNVTFYQRFGFEVRGDAQPTKSGIPFWGMVREPHT